MKIPGDPKAVVSYEHVGLLELLAKAKDYVSRLQFLLLHYMLAHRSGFLSSDTSYILSWKTLRPTGILWVTEWWLFSLVAAP